MPALMRSRRAGSPGPCSRACGSSVPTVRPHACTRQTLAGPTATRSASSIMKVKRR